jgi:hypothetical protein
MNCFSLEKQKSLEEKWLQVQLRWNGASLFGGWIGVLYHVKGTDFPQTSMPVMRPI